MTTFLLLLTLLLLTTIQAAVTSKDTERWANTLSLQFGDFINKTMKVPVIQTAFDKTPKSSTFKNGKVESSAAAALISSALSEKDTSLRALASVVQNAEAKHNDQDFITFSTADLKMEMKNILHASKAANDHQLLRTYFTHHDTGATTLHSTPGLTADTETSPPTASTASYTPIYPSGGTQEYPWLKTTAYDPRQTPWYANAVAGPKDVFIIVDDRAMVSTVDAKRAQVERTLLKQVRLHLNDNLF